MSKGFTLVELLITMSIMAMLMVVVSFNYSQYSQLWDKSFGNFEQRLITMKLRLQLRESLQSMIPYIVTDDKGGKVYYFLGRNEGMTFVTNSPIFSSNGGTAVVRIFKENSANNTFRLVYEEASLIDEPLLHINQTLNFKYRLIVEENLQNVAFQYFGWESFNIKYLGENGTGGPFWSSEFDGEIRKVQPEIIQINTSVNHYIVRTAVGESSLINKFIDPEV